MKLQTIENIFYSPIYILEKKLLNLINCANFVFFEFAPTGFGQN